MLPHLASAARCAGEAPWLLEPSLLSLVVAGEIGRARLLPARLNLGMVDSYSAMESPSPLPGAKSGAGKSPRQAPKRPGLPMSGEVGIGDFLTQEESPSSYLKNVRELSRPRHPLIFALRCLRHGFSASLHKGLVCGSAREMDATFLMADAETGDSCHSGCTPVQVPGKKGAAVQIAPSPAEVSVHEETARTSVGK